ncbi:uncharacterized protein [Coffea arabica]|uniref:RNase H type-1 domain-containing protein n=1 Tax=Coffea arabica TaxID=13443 RepID=A0ABM4VZ98_COFAR
MGYLVWNEDSMGQGFKRVVLETDSKVSLETIDKAPTESPLLVQVNRIQSLGDRQWQCELTHQWREGNLSADCLAKSALNLEAGVQELAFPPTELRKWLAYDVVGVTTPRLVAM